MLRVGAVSALAADTNDPTFSDAHDVEGAGNFVSCDLVCHLLSPSAPPWGRCLMEIPIA